MKNSYLKHGNINSHKVSVAALFIADHINAFHLTVHRFMCRKIEENKALQKPGRKGSGVSMMNSPRIKIEEEEDYSVDTPFPCESVSRAHNHLKQSGRVGLSGKNTAYCITLDR